MKIGYARVSTIEQNEARQMEALREEGVDKIYMDKKSGKDFNRPEYQKMIASLQKGDVLVIHSIDRLGRNYEEIIAEWRKITKEIEADIVVQDMPLLNTTQNKDLMQSIRQLFRHMLFRIQTPTTVDARPLLQECSRGFLVERMVINHAKTILYERGLMASSLCFSP